MRTVVSSYLVPYVRGRMIRALEQGIQHGSLQLTDHHGVQLLFGSLSSEQPSATLNVKNDDFWLRIYCSRNLGLSEAYMHGDFETNDLKTFLNLWLKNRVYMARLWSPIDHFISAILAFILGLFVQSLLNDKLGVVTCCDQDKDLFKGFLSEDMVYSCAIWPGNLGGVRGDLVEGPFTGDLEAAQLHKIHHVLKKARLRPGDRLLEFGTGWGTIAIEAAKLGCYVDTLTLSIKQKKEAEEYIRRAGLESRVRVHLLDYRNLPSSFKNAFDAFVALEMVEHVGLEHHDRFFQVLDWALKRDRAAVVMSATTQPEWRYSTFQTTDCARKYQWPDTFYPSPTTLARKAMTAVPGAFALESVEDYGSHYPRTIREWGRRLQTNWRRLSSALIKSHPELLEGDNLGILKRKWEYMYAYAEIGFATGYTSLHYWTFARPENIVAPCH